MIFAISESCKRLLHGHDSSPKYVATPNGARNEMTRLTGHLDEKAASAAVPSSGSIYSARFAARENKDERDLFSSIARIRKNVLVQFQYFRANSI